jgi:hypothetical protein
MVGKEFTLLVLRVLAIISILLLFICVRIGVI